MPTFSPASRSSARTPFSTSRRLLSTIRRAVSNARQERQAGLFTCTARYHPVRMICAIPRASLRSVLFGIAQQYVALSLYWFSYVWAMPNKTDRNDARGIAQIMRTGWYRAVHVKTPSCRSWRALLTARRMVLNKRRDVENGLRALLREAGLKVGTPSRRDFPARVRELAADDLVLASLVEPLLSIVDVMTDELARLTKRVLDDVRVEPNAAG